MITPEGKCDEQISFVDMVPGVAQLKSGFQLLLGDKDGAAKTQQNFFNDGIVTSQARSTYFLVTGEPNKAWDIQKKFGSNMEPVVDSVPVIGHAIGLVHLAVGDDAHGWDAIKSVTSNTGSMIGGMLGGPLGAVAGHVVTDAAITVTDKIINKDKM